MDPRDRIAALNDEFRRTGVGGRTVITYGVRQLGDEAVRRALEAVRTFEAFTEENDPYGEHDFGSFKIAGRTLFFKIDLYEDLSVKAADGSVVSQFEILARGIRPEGPDQKSGRRDPDGDDHRRGHAARGPALGRDRGRAVFRHDLRWDQLYGEHDPEREDNQLVQVAQDGDEVGDRVDRAQGIGGDSGRNRLSVPGGAWITRGEVERHHVALDAPRPGLKGGDPRHPCSASDPAPFKPRHYRRLPRRHARADDHVSRRILNLCAWYCHPGVFS